MSYVFAAPATPTAEVVDSSDFFPVHRVYCVGRNYEAHAREMGHDAREAPFFFDLSRFFAPHCPTGRHRPFGWDTFVPLIGRVH